MKRLIISLLALGVCVLFSTAVKADTVGNIQVCYNCSGPAGNNFGFGVQDSPIFAINNTSASAITGATLTIGVGGDNATLDTFNVGNIAAGGQVLIEVGVTSDGGFGHTFFTTGGPVRDTSDVGPNSDSVPFAFLGTQGVVVSANFTPGDTAQTSLDGTIAKINFLGGGPSSDGPCNNCFFGTVAFLTTPSATTPEPSSLLLLGTGLLALGLALKKTIA